MVPHDIQVYTGILFLPFEHKKKFISSSFFSPSNILYMYFNIC